MVPGHAPSFALNFPGSSEIPVPRAGNDSKGQKLWSFELPAASMIILKPRSDPLSLLLQNLRQVSCLLGQVQVPYLALEIFHSLASFLSSLSPYTHHYMPNAPISYTTPHPPTIIFSHLYDFFHNQVFFLLMPSTPTTTLTPGEILSTFKLKLKLASFGSLSGLPPSFVLLYYFEYFYQGIYHNVL